MFEIVNKRDGSRLSHHEGKGSTTLFKTSESAGTWVSDQVARGRMNSADYEIKEAKE